MCIYLYLSIILKKKSMTTSQKTNDKIKYVKGTIEEGKKFD